MSRLTVKVQQRSEQGTANVGIRLVAVDGTLGLTGGVASCITPR